MMYSGVDLVEICRIKKAMENPRFLLKYFGEKERAELEKKGFRPESVAACFAAKEAFSKVVKTGLSGFSLCEAELLHEQSGAPYLYLSGKAKQIADEKGLTLSVSISHTDSLAIAFIIGFQE